MADPFPQVNVMYAFARSGGTLVNQLLGCHPDAFVLSEVNPTASSKSLFDQAQEWLGLLHHDDYRFFTLKPYSEQLARLYDLTCRQGKRLIVRDWVTVNFLPNAGGPGINPSGLLEQSLYLRRAGLKPMGFVVCRRALHVYESIRSNFEQFQGLDAASFAQAYWIYVQAVAHMPRIQLEALQLDPVTVLPALNDMAGLSNQYMDTQLTNFASFDRCTGDNTLRRHRRAGTGISARIVHSATKKRTDPEMRGAAGELMRQADECLGYE